MKVVGELGKAYTDVPYESILIKNGSFRCYNVKAF